ncbi:MAG: MBL fold metallo-hydrolase, partial [Candidatus Firestonebacteria bacterium]|nr:MBL fold metallo-hydrolase [Candidatus Firestonebacteria bacterium]
TKTRKTAVIDPGSSQCWEIIDFIKQESLELIYIINTHGHVDHIAGNNFLKEHFPQAKILIHPLDEPMLHNSQKNLSSFYDFYEQKEISSIADGLINENDVISLGDIKFHILHTPGHTKGSISLLLDNKNIFCGDTLFKYSIGRTDLPGGSYESIISSIKTKLFLLDDSSNVYPGHGEFTTIGKERRKNPYLI